MQLTTLVLRHIRNYAKRQFSFSSPVTIIIGPNASGKTNILEAISFATFGKSFRAKQGSDVISWGSDVGNIRVSAVTTEGPLDLEVVITRGTVNGQKTPHKRYFVNGVARRLIDFTGNLRSVLFSPTDLELVTDSPGLRRDYLDRVLVQVDREYRRNLQSYERGLRQRNSLLERIANGVASRSQLLFWDQLLIKTGQLITKTRELYIAFLNTFSFDGVSCRIDYDPSIISDVRLLSYKDEEIAAKTTLVGPQRDDFSFFKKDIDLSRFGSRGEQRMAVLWLKLAELAFIEKHASERPILLLDDIFSELDEGGRRLVSRIIDKQQTIITSAQDGDFPGAQIIRL